MIDFPHFVPISDYECAIQRMTDRLRQLDGVVSIFQIGSVNSPGISDIDMLVIFEDGARCSFNPRESLSKTERYLFAHALYGTSIKQFSDAQKCAMFHKYNLLYGEKLPFIQNDLPEHQAQNVITQIALEYLIKMFIDSSIELTYGIVKVRGLLMHTKALSYDLEFLNIASGRLYDLVQIIIGWRDHWFEKKPNMQELCQWFNDFYAVFTEFLRIELRRRTFFLPQDIDLRIARNIILEPAETFSYVHTGMRLPPLFGGLGRKYFNVQHRFNRFRFKIPASDCDVPNILRDRFIFVKQMKRTNSDSLPCFMPLTSSLNIFS